MWECDLSEAVLGNTVPTFPSEYNRELRRMYTTCLRGTLYDEFTRWPERIDPRAAGAILDE